MPQRSNVISTQDVGFIPAFFDLDLDFDLYPGEWIVLIAEEQNSLRPVTDVSLREDAASLQSVTVLKSILPTTFANVSHNDMLPMTAETYAAVVIRPEGHELIQYYLNVMTTYTKIRHTANDHIYSQIFSNMALFYPPLYNAIMAWTGLHLGQTKAAFPVEEAEERYQRAISLTHADQGNSSHFEHCLVTIWFLLQYELLAASGPEQFCPHLGYAADTVETQRRHHKAGGNALSLSPIGARILVWLDSYDVRASYAGSHGRLLQKLVTLTDSHDFISTAFADVSAEPGMADLKDCLRLVLNLDALESRMLQSHRKGCNVPGPIWSAIQSDMLLLRRRVECNPFIAPAVAAVANLSNSQGGKLTTKSFNGLLLLASFYSIVIGYYRMLPPLAGHSSTDDLAELMGAETAAARIIRITLWVSQRRPPSPQYVWPRLLFLAGTETADCVYQSWVIKTLSEAEVWGTNFRKTRLLLEEVLDQKQRGGTNSFNFHEVTRRTTEVFVI